jgi:hypothetical protein
MISWDKYLSLVDVRSQGHRQGVLQHPDNGSIWPACLACGEWSIAHDLHLLYKYNHVVWQHVVRSGYRVQDAVKPFKVLINIPTTHLVFVTSSLPGAGGAGALYGGLLELHCDCSISETVHHRDLRSTLQASEGGVFAILYRTHWRLHNPICLSDAILNN